MGVSAFRDGSLSRPPSHQTGSSLAAAPPRGTALGQSARRWRRQGGIAVQHPIRDLGASSERTKRGGSETHAFDFPSGAIASTRAMTSDNRRQYAISSLSRVRPLAVIE